MTLFAVIVLCGLIYEKPHLLGLITMQGTPIDTDQPRRNNVWQFCDFVNNFVMFHNIEKIAFVIASEAKQSTQDCFVYMWN